MKTLLSAGAALALVSGASLPPALAQANPPARWGTSQAASRTVEQAAADAVAPSPRYEYQYHYGGSPRHPHWELQRVLVK